MARNGINVTGLEQMNDPKEAGKPHNVDGDEDGDDPDKEREKDSEGEDDEKNGQKESDRNGEGESEDEDEKENDGNKQISVGDLNSKRRPETQSSTSYGVRRLLHMQEVHLNLN